MSEHVKILGVYLDTAMALEKQISTTCRTAYIHILFCLIYTKFIQRSIHKQACSNALLNN